MPNASTLIQPAFSQAVETWTAQAVVASGHLVRLYDALEDELQAAAAQEAAGHCGEGVQQLGLNAKVAALDCAFNADNPDETQGEARAWKWLVEAQAGLSACHGVVADSWEEAAFKAFLASVKGYLVAFPEEMACQGIQMAIQSATGQCLSAMPQEPAGPLDTESLGQRIRAALLTALPQESAAGLGT